MLHFFCFQRAKKKVFDPSDNNLPKVKRRPRQAPAPEKTAKSTPAPVKSQSQVTSGQPSKSVASSVTSSNGVSPVPANRSSNGSSTNRVPNGIAVHKVQNGPSTQKSVSSTPESTVKDVKPSLPPPNKLNAIGTGTVAACAICITAIVDGKAIQCKDCNQKGIASKQCFFKKTDEDDCISFIHKINLTMFYFQLIFHVLFVETELGFVQIHGNV